MYIIIGSHGTGKSTLLNEMKNDSRFENLIFKEGPNRDFSKIKDFCGDRFFQDIINRIFIYNWKYDRANKNLLSIRSIIDGLAYTKAQGFYYKDIMDEIKSIGIDNIKVFYIPIKFDLVNDGVRPMDKLYQEKVDKCMIEIMNELEIKYITIESNSAEERIEEIYNNLK